MNLWRMKYEKNKNKPNNNYREFSKFELDILKELIRLSEANHLVILRNFQFNVFNVDFHLSERAPDNSDRNKYQFFVAYSPKDDVEMGKTIIAAEKNISNILSLFSYLQENNLIVSNELLETTEGYGNTLLDPFMNAALIPVNQNNLEILYKLSKSIFIVSEELIAFVNKETETVVEKRLKFVEEKSGERITLNTVILFGEILVGIWTIYAMYKTTELQKVLIQNNPLQISSKRCCHNTTPIVTCKKESPVQINSINFEVNETTIDKFAYDELNKLVKFLKDNLNLNLTITGHADILGIEEDNIGLSERRAKAIKDYLLRYNVKNDINILGLSDDNPTYSGSSVGYSANRRVEFQFEEAIK
jgi:outer membrane protein OmpA-like peptidoglycan-associated protein